MCEMRTAHCLGLAAWSQDRCQAELFQQVLAPLHRSSAVLQGESPALVFARCPCDDEKVKEGETVCDLGSHVGCYSIPLAFHVGPTGRVYAFEPFRVVFQRLTGNAAINGVANVYTHNLALGDTSEVLRRQSPALRRSSNIGATAVFLQAKEASLMHQGNALLGLRARGTKARTTPACYQWCVLRLGLLLSSLKFKDIAQSKRQRSRSFCTLDTCPLGRPSRKCGPCTLHEVLRSISRPPWSCTHLDLLMAAISSAMCPYTPISPMIYAWMLFPFGSRPMTSKTVI